MRGNPAGVAGEVVQVGSIPACAGEPTLASSRSMASSVYPRVCGGTRCTRCRAPAMEGLSPRVRGNRHQRRCYRSRQGSIPACAGEPSAVFDGRGGGQVYPRVCGGTAAHQLRRRAGQGLSPRVRGNRCPCPRRRRRSRSIPACAGEPSCWDRAACVYAVYPRVCGGTPEQHPPAWRLWGLSPRVRGNRDAVLFPQVALRSIPACAGEPAGLGSRRATVKVYPRVCGGTSRLRRRQSCLPGLSPRVRGNRYCSEFRRHCQGSIPACAGEPPPLGETRHWTAVYPRVCGGTWGSHSRAKTRIGLSPRVRGNRQRF